MLFNLSILLAELYALIILLFFTDLLEDMFANDFCAEFSLFINISYRWELFAWDCLLDDGLDYG